MRTAQSGCQAVWSAEEEGRLADGAQAEHDHQDPLNVDLGHLRDGVSEHLLLGCDCVLDAVDPRQLPCHTGELGITQIPRNGITALACTIASPLAGVISKPAPRGSPRTPAPGDIHRRVGPEPLLARLCLWQQEHHQR